MHSGLANRMILLVGLGALGLGASCSSCSGSGPDTPDGGADLDAAMSNDGFGATDSGAVRDMRPQDIGATDMAEEPLRPNIQRDIPPNAEDQTPAFPAQTRAPQPAQPTAVSTEVWAEGLGIPWGIAPLPNGRLLVTERAGRLRLVDTDGSVSDPLAGVPEVAATGQGGLLDVKIGPNFVEDRSVFLSFSEDRGGGNTAPAVARATLSVDGSRLEGLTVLYQQDPPRPESRHYGSRIVFDDSGALFATFGDRGGAFEDAQSPDNGIGAVVRILPDGSIPQDNPFADGVDGDPAVWSWGHRNIQSATIGPDGALWTVEHGPRGGDELNRPEPGVNHGWPVITYGIDYNGQPVGDGLTAQEGMAQPVYYWDPVIAPSGMATYTGELFERWQGDLLIGGLQAEALVRLTLRDQRVHTEEWIPMGVRVRSVAIANDGAVLVGTDAGEIVALRPE
jgi:glucose/arabinose dehydrogenase